MMDGGNAQLGLQLAEAPIPEPAAGIWRIISRECRGRENAIPMPELAERVGLSTRSVQGEIEYLIKEQGKMIGSSCSPACPGYYEIIDQADRELTYRNLMNRAVSAWRRAAKINRREAVQEMQGQISMVEVVNG